MRRQGTSARLATASALTPKCLLMSSPDGQVSEMAKNGGVGGGGVGSVRHLLDLHKGYRAPPRAHAWQDRLADGRDGCARGGARSGLRQVEEMPNRPVVVEELARQRGSGTPGGRAADE